MKNAAGRKSQAAKRMTKKTAKQKKKNSPLCDDRRLVSLPSRSVRLPCLGSVPIECPPPPTEDVSLEAELRRRNRPEPAREGDVPRSRLDCCDDDDGDVGTIVLFFFFLSFSLSQREKMCLVEKKKLRGRGEKKPLARSLFVSSGPWNGREQRPWLACLSLVLSLVLK